jgi:hypothetical protein
MTSFPSTIRAIEDEITQKFAFQRVLQTRWNTHKIEAEARTMSDSDFEKMLESASPKVKILWRQIRAMPQSDWEREWKISELKISELKTEGEIKILRDKLARLLS